MNRTSVSRCIAGVIALAFAALLSACGGGGSGGGASVLQPLAAAGRFETLSTAEEQHPPLGGFLTSAGVTVDGSGFVIGEATIGQWVESRGVLARVNVSFSGTAVVDAGGNWTIPAATVRVKVTNYASDVDLPAIITTVPLTGTVSAGNALSLTIPSALLPAGYPNSLVAPYRPDPSTQIAGIYYEYTEGFEVDASGRVHGRFSGCDITGTLGSQAGYVLFGELALSGSNCPARLVGTHRFIGRIMGERFTLETIIDGEIVVNGGAQIHGASIPDGSTSSVPGFTEPVVSALVPFAGGYIWPDVPPEGPYTAAALYVDATGRFLLRGFASYPDHPDPDAEEIVTGMLTASGDAWVATGITAMHRDSASSPWVAGSAAVTASFSKIGDDFAHVQLSVSGSPILAAGSPYDMRAYLPTYAQPPFQIPHSGAFNGYRLVIDSNTGRIHGNLAPGCDVEGVMSLATPTANMYKLRATVSGSGCAAAGLTVGTGGFLGYEFVGVRWSSGVSWQFTGIVDGRVATLSFGY